MLKTAAVCSVFLGLGFGIPCLFGLLHFARTHEVWTFLGFPTSVPLLAGYLLVCLLEVAVGVALWFGAPHAAAYSLALLPLEAVFWVGFALPLGPPLGIARVVLALLA